MKVFLIIATIVLAIYGVGYGIWRLNKFDCNRLAANASVETKFDWLGDGCYVKVDNKFVPEDRWRAFND